MAKKKKNNVVRLLESRKVTHTVFTLPTEKLGAEETARQLGMSPSVVFKTIVFTRVGKGKAILAVIPGNKEVNPKAVARALGEKKVRLTTQAEAERLTGLQAGGISPLALINKGFDVVLDDSAEGLGEIHISGGERGVNVRLPVKAFCDLTRAQFAPLTDA